MGVEASIQVERQKEFGELKRALLRALAPSEVDQFLHRLQAKGIRIRDIDLVLASGVLEQGDEELARAGARKLYDALTISDHAQLREFYLLKIEEVDSRLRTKYQKLYRYY